MPFRFPFPYPANYYNTYMNYNNYKNKAISNKPLNTEKASHNQNNNYSKSNSYKDRNYSLKLNENARFRIELTIK